MVARSAYFGAPVGLPEHATLPPGGTPPRPSRGSIPGSGPHMTGHGS